MLRFKIHYWPVFTSALFVFTIVLTYLIAVYNGHVYMFFPYLSDSGTLPPESCIFSLLQNLQALTRGLNPPCCRPYSLAEFGVTLYIRYRQVDLDIKSGTIKLSERWNTMSFYVLITICSGIVIVSNFQETNVFLVHIFGAGMAFGNGTLYFCIQTRISFASHSSESNYRVGTKLFYFRILLALLLLSLGFLVGVCGFIAIQEFTGESTNWWTEKEGGIQMKLISAFAEWLLALVMFAYICTFTNEFKSLNYEEIVITSKCKMNRFQDE